VNEPLLSSVADQPSAVNRDHHTDGAGSLPPFDLQGLKTYDLAARPSKVFHADLGQPVGADATVGQWLAALPRQLAGNSLRRVCAHVCRAHEQGRTVAAALGGHVIKTGCGPYLVDWLQKGVLNGVAMNGAAAIHDLELALAGKTSEDVATQLPAGKFGMARETADAFAVAARAGAEHDRGLGWALGKFLDDQHCAYPDGSLLLAAYRAGVPCTVHVALGTDIVHMHPHVSGAALGESSLIDFRRLCRVVAGMKDGLWFNLGSAVVMPEVFVKAVAVARNFGYDLAGLVTVNIDKQAQYRSRVNVLERPADEGIELIGHHELLIPLLHAAVASELAAAKSAPLTRPLAA
jgi:hypothetical protein